MDREDIWFHLICRWYGHKFTIRKMHYQLCKRCRYSLPDIGYLKCKGPCGYFYESWYLCKTHGLCGDCHVRCDIHD